MPRWLWFAPLAGLTALLATGVYQIGRDRHALTESEVIAAAVALYLDQSVAAGRDARPEDCIAVPGQGRVWIRVRCGGVEYRVDRMGRLLPPPQGGI